MLKIYGYAVSNYFCMLKQALLEKGIAFETVETRPNQEPAFLEKSPMGKIPVLETEQGFLSETAVILDYLEECYPDQALYPAEPFARAKVKQLMRVVELYVECPTHALLPILLGREMDEHIVRHQQHLLDRGMQALRRLVTIGPYIAGEQFGYADIVAFWSLSLAGRVGKRVYERRLVDEIGGLADWRQLMSERPTTAQLMAESTAAMKQMQSG